MNDRLDRPTIRLPPPQRSVLPLAVDEASGILEPNQGGLAERLGGRFQAHHPVTVGGTVVLVGYLLLSALLIGLGLILTKLLVGGPVGMWDNSVNRWFVTQRTTTLNTVSNVGSLLGTTLTVIGIAVAVSIVLAFGRHWRQLGFLAAALTLESAVTLTTGIVVNRPRPNVHRLDVTPPTASFPSGHTAAALVLYASLAIVLVSFVRNPAARALAWIFAIAIPIFVGISRLYRGMHHPTDVMGSVVIGAGCLMFALLASRTAGAITDQRVHEVATEASSRSDVEVQS
jgi:membrane-associated phospholipid phosphatase